MRMKPASLVGAVIVVGIALLAFNFFRQEPSGPFPPDHSPGQEPLLQASPASVEAPSESEALVLSPESTQASGDRQGLPAPGPRGMVIEVGSERPIEGLTVRMRRGTTVLAETVTGVDGSFLLPRPEKKRPLVEIVTEEWRLAPSVQRLDADQSRGLVELVFRAEHIVSETLRGILIDRRTDEPIPEFLLEARGPRGERTTTWTEADPTSGEDRVALEFQPPPKRVESILTGNDGRFGSTGRFEAGVLDLVLLDHPQSPARGRSPSEAARTVEYRHEIDEGIPSREVELRIVIGPTYLLETDLPRGTAIEDFFATFPGPLVASELHRLVGSDPDSPMARFYGSALKQSALDSVAPLRRGERIWTRFREPVIDYPGQVQDPSGARELHVRSRDGYWSAQATVSSVVGVYPRVVPMTLEARGVVEGAVVDSKGNPVPTAWIMLSSLSESTSPSHQVGADANGRFEFRWLVPAEYEVAIETDRYGPWKSTVVVEGGSTEHLEARLRSRAPLGAVSGMLRSRTGRHRSKGGVLSLRSLENPDFFLLQTATYTSRNGEYVAEFAFKDVPNGRYELSLKPLDNLRWETRRMTVSPPAEGLEFLCEDDMPTFDFEFLAIDAETGTPIEQSWSIVWQGSPLEDVRLDAQWDTGVYEDVPEQVALHWVLRAGGYRLATGDESTIRDRADHRVVEVGLVRGWGQIFKVTAREGSPIEGVHLYADGSPLGATDSLGMVSMDLDGKPHSLEFRYEGWHVSWGEVDPQEENFGWGPETPVYLSPDD